MVGYAGGSCRSSPYHGYLCGCTSESLYVTYMRVWPSGLNQRALSRRRTSVSYRKSGTPLKITPGTPRIVDRRVCDSRKTHTASSIGAVEAKQYISLTIISDPADQRLKHFRLVVDIIIVHEHQRGPDWGPLRVLDQRRRAVVLDRGHRDLVPEGKNGLIFVLDAKLDDFLIHMWYAEGSELVILR